MNTKKIMKNVKAVSPVIATLMLVLVAVGSAGAFYVWQSNWQKETTAGVENTDTRTTLTIGGSSTVYPVSVIAAEAFMTEYPQFKVEIQKGGSDSGIIGGSTGIVDIGAASKAMDDDYKEAYPNAVETIIGYDGVVVCVSDSNTHNLTSINRTTLATIYSVNGGLTPESASDIDSGLDGDGDGTIQWDEVPTAPGSATNCTGTQAVQVYERGEKSGTEECFGEKILAKIFGKQFSLSGVNAHSPVSNQDLRTALGADADGIGFMAFGLCGDEAGGDGVLTQIPFGADGTAPSLPDYAEIAANTWVGSRPLVYITDGDPSGVPNLFINYVLQTENNQDFLHEAAYVSIFD